MVRTLVAIIGAFCIIGASTIACSDSDINHPVLCYHHKRVIDASPHDSILIGKMIFDPLPEYQKPSKVLVEWYCDREITKNLNLRVEGPVWNYQLSRPLPVWHAPIHKGDTVRAELTITPLTVGIVDLRLYAGEPVMFPEGDSLVPREISRASLRTAFVLGPNGQTTAMNSPATNQPYATFLGPLPEVMAESLLFFLNPKFPVELAGLNPVSKSPLRPIFAIEGIVYTQPDDSGYRSVTCRVSPYFQFDAGIGFQVNRSEDVIIKDASPSVIHPVSPRDTIEFSLWYRVMQSGISRVSLHFQTFNPDYGKSDGPIGYPELDEIGTYLPLYLGYDRDMTLLFITDQTPSDKGTYDRAGKWNDSKRWLIQQQMDPRVAWVGGLPAIRKEWKSYDSEGFDKVMNYGRKPVEVVLPKRGR